MTGYFLEWLLMHLLYFRRASNDWHVHLLELLVPLFIILRPRNCCICSRYQMLGGHFVSISSSYLTENSNTNVTFEVLTDCVETVC